MVCPAWKFRFDEPGRLIPDGHTVTYPPACGSTAVTVSTRRHCAADHRGVHGGRLETEHLPGELETGAGIGDPGR